MSENITEDDKLLTVEDVAALLNVRPAYVYAMAANGTMPRIKLGRHVRFRRAAVDAYIASLEQVSEPEPEPDPEQLVTRRRRRSA